MQRKWMVMHMAEEVTYSEMLEYKGRNITYEELKEEVQQCALTFKKIYDERILSKGLPKFRIESQEIEELQRQDDTTFKSKRDDLFWALCTLKEYEFRQYNRQNMGKGKLEQGVAHMRERMYYGYITCILPSIRSYDVKSGTPFFYYFRKVVSHAIKEEALDLTLDAGKYIDINAGQLGVSHRNVNLMRKLLKYAKSVDPEVGADIHYLEEASICEKIARLFAEEQLQQKEGAMQLDFSSDSYQKKLNKEIEKTKSLLDLIYQCSAIVPYDPEYAENTEGFSVEDTFTHIEIEPQVIETVAMVLENYPKDSHREMLKGLLTNAIAGDCRNQIYGKKSGEFSEEELRFILCYDYVKNERHRENQKGHNEKNKVGEFADEQLKEYRKDWEEYEAKAIKVFSHIQSWEDVEGALFEYIFPTKYVNFILKPPKIQVDFIKIEKNSSEQTKKDSVPDMEPEKFEASNLADFLLWRFRETEEGKKRRFTQKDLAAYIGKTNILKKDKSIYDQFILKLGEYFPDYVRKGGVSR